MHAQQPAVAARIRPGGRRGGRLASRLGRAQQLAAGIEGQQVRERQARRPHLHQLAPALIERQTLAEQHDGLVFAYGDDQDPGNPTPLDELNLQQLRQLYLALKANGIKLR